MANRYYAMCKKSEKLLLVGSSVHNKFIAFCDICEEVHEFTKSEVTDIKGEKIGKIRRKRITA